MCGRFAVKTPSPKLAKQFHANLFESSGSILAKMQSWPVDRLVNKVGDDDTAKCIKKAKP